MGSRARGGRLGDKGGYRGEKGEGGGREGVQEISFHPIITTGEGFCAIHLRRFYNLCNI